MPEGTTLLPKRCILWQMWGNEAALLSSYVMTMGGIVGVVGGTLSEYPFWFPVGVYAIVCGVFISMIEYPRGEKNKGRSLKRSHQDIFTTIVDKLGIFSKFSYRAIIYLILATPCLISIPTLLGGLSVFVSCFIYFHAARMDETWRPIKVEKEKTAQPKTVTTSAPDVEAPSRPPPRLPSNTPAVEAPSKPPPRLPSNAPIQEDYYSIPPRAPTRNY